VADRESGLVRRATVSRRLLLLLAGVAVATPILIGMGAAWKAYDDVASLRASHQALEMENANYRQATAALAGQIESLQTAIGDLGERAAVDPALARAMNRLPAIVKSRAMGGTGGTAPGTSPQDQDNRYARTLAALVSPDDTFGLIRSVLSGLESRLQLVARNVDRLNELAEATPSIWPAYGWLSSSMGVRRDPITGTVDYHKGLDIAGERGEPVYATAAGTITQAGVQGAYGNLVVIDHGFGLETRYGHLLRSLVKVGAKVQRGDVIGQIGSSGRATGNHLHYEVMAGGRLINPLGLLTSKPQRQ
jgi:murein DD-endopeptidase MepM/ murein hydrolase activator NlpD